MTGRTVLTGKHFMNGDHACAEGAIAAGCRFFAGYPITPSTEIAERLASRLPQIGGVFIQMEDELGSIAAILGAAAAGANAMTATSGPGFSLMMENIGLAVMMELPCVVVDIQRGSPSTGLPTMAGQSDVMQARWGSHGDYEIAAYSPWSPQEIFDLTILAFNVSNRYRIPVLIMADEVMWSALSSHRKMILSDGRERNPKSRRMASFRLSKWMIQTSFLPSPMQGMATKFIILA